VTDGETRKTTATTPKGTRCRPRRAIGQAPAAYHLARGVGQTTTVRTVAINLAQPLFVEQQAIHEHLRRRRLARSADLALCAGFVKAALDTSAT